MIASAPPPRVSRASIETAPPMSAPTAGRMNSSQGPEYRACGRERLSFAMRSQRDATGEPLEDEVLGDVEALDEQQGREAHGCADRGRVQ